MKTGSPFACQSARVCRTFPRTSASLSDAARGVCCWQRRAAGVQTCSLGRTAALRWSPPGPAHSPSGRSWPISTTQKQPTYFKKHSKCNSHYVSRSSAKQIHLQQLASCLIYSYALIEYINRFAVDGMVTFFFVVLYLPWNSRKKTCSFSWFSVKNAKTVQL